MGLEHQARRPVDANEQTARLLETIDDGPPDFGDALQLDALAPGGLVQCRRRIRLQDGDYALRLTRTPSGLCADETGKRFTAFGLNVTFEGIYQRVAQGAEALPKGPLSQFESEFWPEEGRPVFAARVRRLILYERPDLNSPIAGEIELDAGERVVYSLFRYRTVRPGRVVVVKGEAELSGRNLGATNYVSRDNYYEDGGETLRVALSRGDQLGYLQYRAEGSGFVRWRELVIVVPFLPWNELDTAFDLLSEPVAESWVRVEVERLGAVGWVLADAQLAEVDREF